MSMLSICNQSTRLQGEAELLLAAMLDEPASGERVCLLGYLADRLGAMVGDLLDVQDQRSAEGRPASSRVAEAHATKCERLQARARRMALGMREELREEQKQCHKQQ